MSLSAESLAFLEAASQELTTARITASYFPVECLAYLYARCPKKDRPHFHLLAYWLAPVVEIKEKSNPYPFDLHSGDMSIFSMMIRSASVISLDKNSTFSDANAVTAFIKAQELYEHNKSRQQCRQQLSLDL